MADPPDRSPSPSESRTATFSSRKHAPSATLPGGAPSNKSSKNVTTDPNRGKRRGPRKKRIERSTNVEVPRGGSDFDTLSQLSIQDSEGEEIEDDGDEGLQVGSTGIAEQQNEDDDDDEYEPDDGFVAEQEKSDNFNADADFVALDDGDDSEEGEEEEADDKDTVTRSQKRQAPPTNRKLANVAQQQQVIVISDDDDGSPAPVQRVAATTTTTTKTTTVSSTTTVNGTFAPFPPADIVALRTTMSYYTPPVSIDHPSEEARPFIFTKRPVDVSTLLITPTVPLSPERDTKLKEFYARHICETCTAPGHHRDTCPYRTCPVCGDIDDHFPSACPQVTAKEKEQTRRQNPNWWREPPLLYQPPYKKRRTMAESKLRMGCFLCASSEHYGQDCRLWKGKTAVGDTWSLEEARRRGWVGEADEVEDDQDEVQDGVEEKEEGEEVEATFVIDYGGAAPAPTPKNNNHTGNGIQVKGAAAAAARVGNSSSHAHPPPLPSQRYPLPSRPKSPPPASRRGGNNHNRHLPPPPPPPRSPPPPPPPPSRRQPPLPREPLPPPVGYNGNNSATNGEGGDRRRKNPPQVQNPPGSGRRTRGDSGAGGHRPRRGNSSRGRGGGNSGGGGGRGLEERVHMPASSGKREWSRFVNR